MVNIKNKIHKQCDENWVDVLRMYRHRIDLDTSNNPVLDALRRIYIELIEDDRIHDCNALGNYVIPVLLEAISYALPGRKFGWEGQ